MKGQRVVTVRVKKTYRYVLLVCTAHVLPGFGINSNLLADGDEKRNIDHRSRLQLRGLMSDQPANKDVQGQGWIHFVKKRTWARAGVRKGEQMKVDRDRDDNFCLS